ncbi:MAG: bifunctional (p)ppGpp synthetase/guanosine-3',5'-bis(diphosphate) 3'-pyrophosphohydrolase [Candidatus Hydrogenedentes bacterium]|nr:bifunctional (p)ppGpp synthetase/guanosine-3',5'-bis(diphosphate) 3'-pyrophosphohydrolase [Candidatus Hydrogenedentota bacterium]
MKDRTTMIPSIYVCRRITHSGAELATANMPARYAPYMNLCLSRLCEMLVCAIPKQDLMRIGDALILASKLHSGIFRKTGEPYLAHLLDTVRLSFLAGIHEADLLISAVLHDSQEDASDRMPADGLNAYGLPDRVVTSVAALSKVGSPHPTEYFEQVRRFRSARVPKLADRLSNLRSMRGAFSVEKMREYIRETSDELIPICGTKSGGLGRYTDAARILEHQIDESIKAATAFIAAGGGRHVC